jgi:hypothetical protein
LLAVRGEADPFTLRYGGFGPLGLRDLYLDHSIPFGLS